MDEEEDGPAGGRGLVDVHALVGMLAIDGALWPAAPEPQVEAEGGQARVHGFGVRLIELLVVSSIEFVLVVVPPDMRAFDMTGQAELADRLGKSWSCKEARAGCEGGATGDGRRGNRTHEEPLWFATGGKAASAPGYHKIRLVSARGLTAAEAKGHSRSHGVAGRPQQLYRAEAQQIRVLGT